VAWAENGRFDIMTVWSSMVDGEIGRFVRFMMLSNGMPMMKVSLMTSMVVKMCN